MQPSKTSFISAAVIISLFLTGARAAGWNPEGFGAATPGGAGKAVIRVTNLADTGAGSLREALAGGGSRTVVFDVSGEIPLRDFIYIKGSFVTIDGLSAPAPGITLRNRGLIVRGNQGAHDVIVRGMRVRDSSVDGIQVAHGAYNVVIDHCSFYNSLDGNVDITMDSHDITLSWSILAGSGTAKGNFKNSLVKYRISRVSLHHNIYTESLDRNPLVRTDDSDTPQVELATDTTADVRNNIVANWGKGVGTKIYDGSWANVVENYYTSSGKMTVAILVRNARAYIAGNAAADPKIKLNDQGSEPKPFPAPPVATLPPVEAAHAVIAGAGVRPLDAIDATLLSRIRVEPAAKRP